MNEHTSLPLEILGQVLYFGLVIGTAVMAMTAIYAMDQAIRRARNADLRYTFLSPRTRWIWWLSTTIASLSFCGLFIVSFHFGSGLGIQQ